MKSQIIRVALEQPGTDDLIEYTVKTDNRDMVRRELISARKGWPDASAAPILAVSLIAYSALLRSDEIPTNEPVERFLDRCVSARFVNEDGSPVTREQIEAGEGVGIEADPSQPGVEPGY
ncbi:MAG: hypothetical protein K0R01_150 [Mycobacterium sp.]|jgi:hypothetical protein|nr:hypothetical protein [Mycobacterium sp.]